MRSVQFRYSFPFYSPKSISVLVGDFQLVLMKTQFSVEQFKYYFIVKIRMKLMLIKRCAKFEKKHILLNSWVIIGTK